MVILTIFTKNNLKYTSFNGLSFIYIVTLILLIGTFPIHEVEDRDSYFDQYRELQQASLNMVLKDKLFSAYMKFCTLFMNVQVWFVLTSLIYTLNFYYFSKKITRNHFILFLGLITNFVFFAYGINTVRAGLASSFLLLALSKIDNKKLFYFFLLLSVGFHNSMLLPVSAILLARRYNATKYYYYFWIFCIPLSFVFGAQLQLVMASFVEDERFVDYLTKQESDYNMGFRIDFILYSLIPIVAGYYYIFKKNYKDKLYSVIYNSYIIANAFWVLVIRANFSDRFAYLSWYIYMVVLLYPLLNQQLFKKQSRLIALILIYNIVFTIYILR
ncbi:EpsG family protein [Flavobacterium psychrolimnae]|uniref:EpsG family protein n=1 Tax=Flavobacterium psychrolimnae TaxID=249351 RepID=A0A366AX99_9FLAO|nr:EpsG family protein [Flavobacterium psychrolimnae]RBN49499.1 hypothetical protein DR980_12465 [Flavobacterium psychrolimnae]